MKTDELMKIVSSYIESSNRSADEMTSLLVPYIITSQEREIRADERERCVQIAKQVSYYSCEHALAGEKHAYESGRDAVIEVIRKAE